MNENKKRKRKKMKYYTVIGYDYGEEDNWLIRMMAENPSQAAEKALSMAQQVTDQSEVQYVLNGWPKNHTQPTTSTMKPPGTAWEGWKSGKDPGEVHPNIQRRGYVGPKKTITMGKEEFEDLRRFVNGGESKYFQGTPT